MIKPESNAPSSMKPWVRTTDKQIEQLESAVARVESVLDASSENIDYALNQGLSNTFEFIPLEDGSTEAHAGAINFTGAITSESDVSLAGSLIVGDPSRQEYNPTTGEPIGSIPNLKAIAGQLEINPVTEIEYYTTGQLNTTDTTFNLNGYGSINGDGMQITLSNNGQVERQNIAILGATGNGTSETFQIANNASNVAVYTAGKYVNITGVDPDGYNGNNMLITSVNTGVSPMTFTVAGTESGTYVAGGYVTINQPNSIYEGKISVQGPAPSYDGVTVDQVGVHVGTNGGDPVAADVRLDATGLTAPSAFIDQAVINGTRLFISSTPPTAVNDGDIWIDKVGIFTQGGGTVSNPLTVGTSGLTMTTGTSPWNGSAAATIDIDTAKVPRLGAQNIFTEVNTFNNAVNIGSGSTGTVGLEIGSTLNATTPFIDFHSNATANDFDARILASGGTTGTNGAGNLTYTGANHTFNGSLLVNSAASFFSTLTANAGLSSFGTVLAWNNNALSLGVRNGNNAVADLAQYSNNAGTVRGGRTTNGLIYSGTTSAPTLGHAYTLTGAAFVSTSQATFTANTTRSTNPYAVGQKIIVAGVTGGTYNGSWIITGIGGVSGAWTATVTAPGTTTPFTNVAGTGGTGSIESGAFIRSISEGSAVLTLQLAGSSGTSTDFLRLYDGSNNLRTYITSAGDIVAPAISAIWSLTAAAQDVSVNALRVRTSLASGYRANLQTWENSSTVIAGVNSPGKFFTGSTGPLSINVGGTIQSIATGANPLVTMASAHGLAVGEVVTLAGTTGGTYNGSFFVASVPLSTTFTITTALTTGQAGAAGTVALPSQSSITARSAGTIGQIIRGASGQTANLTEWQNNTPSTVARVASNGYIYGSGLFTLNSEIGLESQALNMLKRTSTASSPGGDRGVVYFRDGTTSGTLKLVARTGVSGIEETIVDNLSSTGSTAGAQFVGAGGVRTTGLINTNSSQYGNNILWSAPASTTFYLLATLPTSNAGTFDHLRIDAMYGNWGGGQVSTSTYTFSNRDSFVWRHYLSGHGTIGNIKLRAYSLANGSVEIWVSGEASQFLKFAYNISSAQQVVTVANPVPTTTVPTGTVVFDSSNVATYPPVENQHGRLNIVSTSDANIPFTVTGTTGQTGDLVQFFRGTTYSGAIERGGAFNIQPSQTNNGYALFVRGGASTGIIVRSGGGAIQQWQNSSNQQVGSIAANGSMLIGNTAVADNNYISFITAGGGASGTSGIRWGDDATGSNRFSLAADTTSGTLTLASSIDRAFRVRGSNGHTLNLQEWQSWNGTTATTLSSISSNGSLTVPALTISSGGTYTTGSIYADSNWGMLFRARTASPVNAQYRWANSTDGELMRLDNSGRLIVSNSFSGSTQGAAQIEARTVNATTVGAIIRGFGTGGNYTQTANLQEWQSFNGTTATTLASISSFGSLTISSSLNINGTNSPIVLNGSMGTFGQVLTSNGTASTPTWTTLSNGTVTSVGMTVPTGLTVTPASITTTGTFAVSLQSGYSIPTTTSQANWDTAFSERLQWNGDSTGLVAATGRTSLGATTVGSNFFTLANPTAITFPRINADNTVSALSAADFRTAIGTLSNPMTTAGDIIYGGASGAPTRLAGSGTNNWVLTYDTALAAPKWAAAAGGSFTGGTLTSDLILAAGSGTVEPLTFQTNSATPVTTSGAMDYDGTVFYQTSNTNPGRALSTQDYYYLSNSQYFVDLSTGGLARSLLGANTRGITVAAGTTYDYEAMFAISASFILTSQTPTLAITSTTVTGSPVVNHFTILETGNNTTGFGNAITLGATRITTTQNLTALTTGNRYYIIKMRGRINVTGTGTVKIYPSISASAGSADNGWTVETGAMFKLTPVGNGTVTMVGAWA